MASSFSSSGKKDENRRTLTDFKIVGLEMRELGWTWGILPSEPAPSVSVKAEAKDDASEGLDTSLVSVKPEATEEEVPPNSEKVDEVVEPENIANSSAEAAHAESKSAANGAEVPTGPSRDAQASASISAASGIPPPPSRIRIYFHTPVSADDSHPISLNATSSFSLGLPTPSDSRKGKRKKLEEDDGDLEEEGRGKRPPPPMGSGSQMSDNASIDMDATGRGSVAPSVAETTSEGDWLMAAIVQDDIDGAQDEDGNGETNNDDKLNISHIEDNKDTDVGEGENIGKSIRTLRCDMAYPTSCGRNASSREMPHTIPHR
jgi:20S proteasome subunit alpha 6